MIEKMIVLDYMIILLIGVGIGIWIDMYVSRHITCRRRICKYRTMEDI